MTQLTFQEVAKRIKLALKGKLYILKLFFFRFLFSVGSLRALMASNRLSIMIVRMCHCFLSLYKNEVAAVTVGNIKVLPADQTKCGPAPL